MADKKAPDWVNLQRKIFSRWCRQKLIRRPEYCSLTDICTEIKDGQILIALIEELSEKKYTGKVIKGKITMRIKQIENITNALKFTWDQGVELKLKPSPEQIADGDVTAVLGLLWAIMLRFLKIGDDDDEGSLRLNARDALLLWCKNKCEGYANVPEFQNFKKTGKAPFHTGIALCAIVHKHRPALLPNMDQLNGSNAVECITAAQDAAEKYFGLEKYITPAEVQKLDEQSMVIYVSEFYYGIMEQRKIDLAGRRISKLVKLTIENDRLKEEYNKTAAEYKERLARVEKTLEDRTIDDTMAGAKRRLEEFYKYKTEDKNVLLANQLSLEGLFNNLAMRLAHHKRPAFVPPEGVSLKDVEAALQHLEVVEQERSVALHAELNRQLRLAKLGEEHKSVHGILHEWCLEKEAYLRKHDPIDSVSGAELQLRLLEAFLSEAATTRESSLKRLHDVGAELVRERYEFSADVKAREADVDERFALLDKLAQERQPVLQDDLAREQLRQSTRLLYDEYCEKYNEISAGWVAPKKEYLTRFDEVRSVHEARVQLSLIEAYTSELEISGKPQLEAFRDVGRRILAAQHSSEYSTWQFEHTVTKDPVRDTDAPELRKNVEDHDAELVAAYEELEKLAAQKLKVLQDHLAREEYAEQTRLIAGTMDDKYQQLTSWLSETEAKLAARPEVHSSNDARAELSLLANLKTELARWSEVRLTEFKQIGAELLARSYSSDLSSYTYEHAAVKFPEGDFDSPELRAAVEAHLAEMEKRFNDCGVAAETKEKIYKDHLDRETYAEETRVLAKQHEDQYQRIAAWVSVREAYLKAREDVHSVAEATTQLSVLAAFEKEKGLITQNDVVALKKVGADLLDRKYETEFSSYSFEHTKYAEPAFEHEDAAQRQAISDHEAWVEEKLAGLADLAAAKKAVHEDHLAREELRTKVLLQARQHDDMFGKVTLWLDRKEKYLRARSEINSIADALTQLTLLDRYSAEREAYNKSMIANYDALGAEILAAAYQTDLSSYKLDHVHYTQPEFDEDKPENLAQLNEHIETVKTRWATLADLEKKLLEELQAAHELEKRKEELRLEFAHAALGFTKWCKDTSGNLAIESFGFTLEEVQAHQEFVNSSSAEYQTSAKDRLAKVEQVSSELTQLGVTENVYTDLDMEHVKSSHDQLVASVEARDKAFAAELQRQIENDQLCQQFAKLADPFAKAIVERKDKISSSTEELEAQLAYVQEEIGKLSEGESQLNEMHAVAQKMEERQISYNKHTTLTAKDVDVLWQQFHQFLSKKKEMLEKEIENSKLRGITPEQFREIDSNFQRFDADHNGLLVKKELTACLYSLGEERSSAEVKKLIDTYGDPAKGAMTLENFKEMMIHLLGDSDTKDEVLNGFVLINRGKPYLVMEHMDAVVPKEDTEFILKTAPKKDEGWDYSAWVDEVFAR